MSKYNKELLEDAARRSISVAEVLRHFELKEAGGNYSYIQKLLRKYEVDTSHFLGQKANSGTRHKGGPNKKHWTEVLVKREINIYHHYGKTESSKLRRALIESGCEYICQCCGLGPHWNNKELRLQIDHLNGDTLDNRRENLRFICPNCHTQTGNWGSKNKIQAVMAELADAPNSGFGDLHREGSNPSDGI